MGALTLDLTLNYGPYPNGSPVGHNVCSNAGQSSLSCNAAAPCVPGYYYGWVKATMVAPPGYEPPTSTVEGGSGRPPALISCT